jgi:hypothetical protein
MKELPQKQLVYETLHGMNHHFDQLLLDRLRLSELRLLKLDDLKGLASIIEETRAWINFELVELMQRREQEDWAKFSNLRLQWERKQEDPNDVVIKARRMTVGVREKHRNKGPERRRSKK